MWPTFTPPGPSSEHQFSSTFQCNQVLKLRHTVRARAVGCSTNGLPHIELHGGLAGKFTSLTFPQERLASATLSAASHAILAALQGKLVAVWRESTFSFMTTVRIFVARFLHVIGKGIDREPSIMRSLRLWKNGRSLICPADGIIHRVARSAKYGVVDLAARFRSCIRSYFILSHAEHLTALASSASST
ncbi:hypothetical protein BKA93DRAFT_459917 [Sparassis latifolia]